MDSAGSIGMLVLHDRVLTAKPFPPDAAREAAAEEGGGDGGDDDGGYDEEEVWGRLTPMKAVGFRWEVTESDDGEVRWCCWCCCWHYSSSTNDRELQVWT